MSKSKSSKRITMSDIAEKSDISRQVVSAILQPDKNSNVRYSQETYEKVIKIAKKLNFRPNRTARSLLSKRHGSIGILVKNLWNIPHEVLEKMLEVAKEYDQILTMDYCTDNENDTPILLKEDMVDGIVVFEDIPETFQKEIQKLKIPCIQVNSNTRDLPGSITYDEEKAMAEAVKHLLGKGRKNLAIVSGGGNHYSALAREKGFIKAVKKAKIKPTVCQITEESREKAFIEFFKQNLKIDGIVLSVDSMAPAFYQAAVKLKKKIPKDISVIGVNNSRICEVINPTLTALGVNFVNLGKQIIHELNKYIDQGAPRKYPLVIKYDLKIRKSS